MKRTGFTLPVFLLLLVGLFFASWAKAQSNQNSWGVGNIHEGAAVGVIVGAAAIVGLTTTYLVMHNRGVAVGCVAQSDGKRIFVDSQGRVYSLVADSQSPPIGERVKLKGHKTGPASARSFQLQKVLKDYGSCQS